MPKFMLLMQHAPHKYQKMSPDELQKTMARYQVWMDRIRSSDRYVSSDKLQEEGGKVLSLAGGRLNVTDGPYSETKEVVGGYFMFRAANYEEALDLVRDHPFLADGTIVLRQVDPQSCGGP
jgi:hypothetical protein